MEVGPLSVLCFPSSTISHCHISRNTKSYWSYLVFRRAYRMEVGPLSVLCFPSSAISHCHISRDTNLTGHTSSSEELTGWKLVRCLSYVVGLQQFHTVVSLGTQILLAHTSSPEELTGWKLVRCLSYVVGLQQFHTVISLGTQILLAHTSSPEELTGWKLVRCLSYVVGLQQFHTVISLGTQNLTGTYLVSRRAYRMEVGLLSVICCLSSTISHCSISRNTNPIWRIP